MQPATLPFEVTAEELEALLEGVREGLGEAGYQKLKAAIRTLGYLTELLRERKITLEGLRELLLSGAEASTEKTRHVLKQAGIETQKKNQEKQNSQAKWEAGAARTWPPWSRRLWRSEEGPSSASQLTLRRSLPRLWPGQGLCSGGAGSVGATGGTGAHHRHGL